MAEKFSKGVALPLFFLPLDVFFFDELDDFVPFFFPSKSNTETIPSPLATTHKRFMLPLLFVLLLELIVLLLFLLPNKSSSQHFMEFMNGGLNAVDVDSTNASFSVRAECISFIFHAFTSLLLRFISHFFTVQSYPAEMTSSGLCALKLTAVAHPLEASPCAFLNVCTSGNSSPPSSFITKLTTFTSPLSSAMAILWYFGSSANALMSSEKVLEIIFDFACCCSSSEEEFVVLRLSCNSSTALRAK
mmetsp:Transcript_9921/g.28610  ORF Transcript_9921/g.28610 Transcript_9921/m.28610 type:complete len:246 (-) Transcript_9921:343-1080(-)